jgi:hypothetical protein
MAPLKELVNFCERDLRSAMYVAALGSFFPISLAVVV